MSFYEKSWTLTRQVVSIFFHWLNKPLIDFSPTLNTKTHPLKIMNTGTDLSIRRVSTNIVL